MIHLLGIVFMLTSTKIWINYQLTKFAIRQTNLLLRARLDNTLIFFQNNIYHIRGLLFSILAQGYTCVQLAHYTKHIFLLFSNYFCSFIIYIKIILGTLVRILCSVKTMLNITTLQKNYGRASGQCNLLQILLWLGVCRL